MKEFIENKKLDKSKVVKLGCSNNQLEELPNLSSFVNLTELCCSFNLSSLINLTELSCFDNKLMIAPQSIISCRRLRLINFSNNPIDYIPPNLQRFIERLQDFQTVGNIYNDSQSVHRSSVTNSVKKSIEHLLSDTTNLTKEKLTEIILENKFLSKDVKSRIFQYIEDKEELVHSMVTFEDVLMKVVSRIITYKDPNELFRILDIQMIESECLCLIGRISQLVSVLDRFFDDIRVEISSPEVISSLILQITSLPGTVEEHKEEDYWRVDIL